MSLEQKSKNAIFWSLADKFLKRGIQFIISIFLARLLIPEDFGIVALAGIVIAMVEVFGDFGLGQALVQKKNVSELEYNTIYYINITMGVVLYIVVWFIAPYFASYYKNDILIYVIRLQALSFIFRSLTIVHESLFYKDLNYKIFAKVMVYASGISGVISVILAFLGFGVWSIVVSSILTSFIRATSIIIFSSWKPQRIFSLSSIKELWNKGVRFMGIGFIYNVVSRLDSLFIGKVFSTHTLGIFNRAKSSQELPQYTLLLPITRPLFPVFAKIKDNPEEIHKTFFRSLRLLQYFTIMLFGLMMISSKNIILLLYGDQWTESVPYFRIFLLIMPTVTFGFLFTSLYKGVGKLNSLMFITSQTQSSILIAMVFGYYYGLTEYMIALVTIINSVYISRLYLLKKDFNFNIGKILIQFFKELLLCLAVIALIWYFVDIENNILSIIVNSLIFVLIFVPLSYLLKIEGYFAMKNQVMVLYQHQLVQKILVFLKLKK